MQVTFAEGMRYTGPHFMVRSRFHEYEEENCVLLPAAGWRTHLFHIIFTEPGAHHEVHPCTGFSSEIGTKLRDWAVGQAVGSCYSRAALSSSDSKTLYRESL